MAVSEGRVAGRDCGVRKGVRAGTMAQPVVAAGGGGVAARNGVDHES